MTPDSRAALYALAAAVLALLAGYGLVTAAMAERWLELVPPLIELGGAATALLARRHVPDAPDAGPPAVTP